jgi:hypothetical protein
MARKSAKGIKVGSRVAWVTPYTRHEAEVTEDRGNLGVNGRRLWRILTFATYPDPRLDIEVPEANLVLLSDPAPRPAHDETRPANGLGVGSQVRYRMSGSLHRGEVLHDYGTGGRDGQHLVVVQPFDQYINEPFLWPAEELLPAE